MNKGNNLLSVRQWTKNVANAFGYSIVKYSKDPLVEDDPVFGKIYGECLAYTMTSRERMFALYKAVQYIVDAKIPGDFVECGVWRGGSAMLIARTLCALEVSDRNIYLYDTFEGMSDPTQNDVSMLESTNVFATWKKNKKDDHNEWCYAPLAEVKQNMQKTGYPADKIRYVQGKVEDTLLETKPEMIALLRLDTDWYESTKQELIHLFPLLSRNGVLLLDDYGFWEGSKKAVDEYCTEYAVKMLLNRVDISGRIGIKIE